MHATFDRSPLFKSKALRTACISRAAKNACCLLRVSVQRQTSPTELATQARSIGYGETQ
jgi:hypothetical protein